MGDVTFAHYAGGIVGLALMRRWYLDGDANADRVGELTEILESEAEFPWNLVLNPQERTLADGYAEWSEFYDGPNPLVELEETLVRPWLQRLVAPGDEVLDAACGTGRHAAFLTSLGATCTGADQSAAMLAVARAKLPAVRFEETSIEALPFSDDAFDLAIIALALCHVSDPTTALGELARVVRPGGTIVVTDPHVSMSIAGGQALYGGPRNDRAMRWVRNHYHPASTWLRAIRAGGLEIDECVEAPYSDEQIRKFPIGELFPEAALGAVAGVPALWAWELRVPG